MSKFSKVFKKLRTDGLMTQQELADKLSIAKSTISMYENGNRFPDQESIEAIADFFNVDIDYLYGRTDKTTKYTPKTSIGLTDVYPIEKKRFPLLGEIACGEPIFCNEDRESYVMAGTDIDADFCLKARGDSMINARIFDGDVVFIKETEVNSGDVAAVIIDDEVMLKRYFYFPGENLLTLQSDNPKYSPKYYKNEELEHIRVIGKAVAFQSDVL